MTDAQAIFYAFQISKPKRFFPRWDSNSQPSVLWANKPSYLGEWQEDNCVPMVLIYKVQPCTFHLFIILVGFVVSKLHACYLLGGAG